MALSDSLEYFLSKCYEDAVVKNVGAKRMIDTMRERFDANQNLKSEAQKKLDGLTDDVTKKCFVSKKYKEFLTEALTPTNTGA